MKHKAIYNCYPNAAVIDGDNVYSADGDLLKIDQSLVDAEITRLQTEYAAKQYQRDRAAEYPSFAEQFDLLYHGGLDAWKAAIDAVKTKYPKP